MNCLFCKGSLEQKLTNFMVEAGGCFIIVKNVPSLVCTQCGEVSYSDEVAARLEAIVARVRDVMTEVAVIDFSQSVA